MARSTRGFVEAAAAALTGARRPLGVRDIVGRFRQAGEEGGVAYLGRRPEATLVARLGARERGANGIWEVEPGVWVAAGAGPEGGARAGPEGGARAEGGDAEWRERVLGLIRSMGYRAERAVSETRWVALIGWGSAETRVLVEIDPARGEIEPERVAGLRRSLDANGCLAGLLVVQGEAGEAALAEARRAGAPLITLVDGAVVARSVRGRERGR